MKRFILTGAPGAGKTVILHALKDRGFAVVEEAATDVCAQGQARGNAEPWTSSDFIDAIVRLQRRRERLAKAPLESAVIFDRSPVCTLALARFLGFPVVPALARELDRLEREAVYERRVFFIESLGFITNTDVRRISLEDARRFGQAHEAAYRELGYELVGIAPGPPEGRAEVVAELVRRWS